MLGCICCFARNCARQRSEFVAFRNKAFFADVKRDNCIAVGGDNISTGCDVAVMHFANVMRSFDKCES
ncbi:hypothetical protein D9M70_623440 [compost metagenome]